MLNHKQQFFVLEYAKTLNATAAAKAAGYSERTAYSQGNRLLKNAEIRKALGEVMSEHENELIAGVIQIRQFWTQIMNDTDADLKHRLRASELLGKSLGAFEPQETQENKMSLTDWLKQEF